MELFQTLAYVIIAFSLILLFSYLFTLIYQNFKYSEKEYEEPIKEEEEMSDKRIGTIRIIGIESLNLPLYSLEQFKKIMKIWKEDDILIMYNGAIKCSKIISIFYTLNEGLKDLGFWDTDDGFDNDKDDDKPETPPPTGNGKKTEEEEADDKWLKTVLDDVAMAKKE